MLDQVPLPLEQEFWIVGPPGTGKTRTLKGYVKKKYFEVGRPDGLLLTSFSRVAAATLNQDNLPLPRGQIATLHAICFRALGAPPLAEDPDRLEEWNKLHPTRNLSNQEGDLDESVGEQIAQTEADGIFQEYKLLRAQMVPRNCWSTTVCSFARQWEAWKSDNGLFDFTDLIEYGYQNFEEAPGGPDIIIGDEAQDYDALEIALLRKWGQSTQQLILAFDEDQSIYGFKGADADVFLRQPVPDAQRHVLPQSYRVPPAVQEVAERWIAGVSHRLPKEYRPREGDPGLVRQLHTASFRAPEMAVKDAVAYLDTHPGKRVMFLASCGYMLDPLKAVLRQEGIPFANPFRRRRGDWNPFYSASGTTMAQRLSSYLVPQQHIAVEDRLQLWSPQELRHWIDLVKSDGLLKRGAKKKLEGVLSSLPLDFIDLLEWFDEPALNDLYDYLDTTPQMLSWLEGHLLDNKQKRKSLEFPMQVARRHGWKALVEEPRVWIGTIHSFKGQEADAVYVFPDLSLRGMDEWQLSRRGHDGLIRLFYVAMTRAFDQLVLCDPAGHLGIPWQSALRSPA